MSRLRAFALHLLISLAVMSVVLGLMLLVWYPGDYFRAMGGGKLFFILAGVDVVLGPLLTLVVFRSGKTGLRLDLGIIASLQLAALFYGATVMFIARPAFMVFVEDKFRIAQASALEARHLAAASRPEWRRVPLGGPELVAARRPADPALNKQIAAAALALADLEVFPQAYVPYASAAPEVLRAARPLSALYEIAPGNRAVVDAFLMRAGRPAEAYVFVPLLTPRWDEMAVVLDARDAAYQAILPAKPWR